MALLDFLFNGQPPQSVTTYGTSTSTTQLPQWLSDYTQGMASKANAVAAEPYQVYGGPRIAGFTGDQNNAFSLTRNSVGSWSPLYNAGQNGVMGAMGMNAVSAATPYLGQSASTWTQPGMAQSYMNPYIQNVNDALAQQAGRNLQQYLLPQVNDQFTRAGQFGSAGQTRAVGQTVENLQNQLLEQQSQNLYQGYGQANQAFNSDMSRLGNIGQTLGNLTSSQMQNMGTLGYNAGVLGQIGQANALKDAAALEGIGSEQQQLTQQNLNTAYQDFLDQRDYPKNQLGFMSNIIRGVPYATSSTGSTSQTGPYQGMFQPSPLQQIASAGTGLMSLAPLLSGMLGGLGLKDGGRVMRYADGGPASRAHSKTPDRAMKSYDNYDSYMDSPETSLYMGKNGGYDSDLTGIATMNDRAWAESQDADKHNILYRMLFSRYAKGGSVKGYDDGGAVSAPAQGMANPIGMGRTNGWRGTSSPQPPWPQFSGSGGMASMLQNIAARFPQDMSAFQPHPVMNIPGMGGDDGVPRVNNGQVPPQRDTAPGNPFGGIGQMASQIPGIGGPLGSWLGQMGSTMNDFMGQMRDYVHNPTGQPPQIQLPQFNPQSILQSIQSSIPAPPGGWHQPAPPPAPPQGMPPAPPAPPAMPALPSWASPAGWPPRPNFGNMQSSSMSTSNGQPATASASSYSSFGTPLRMYGAR